MFDYSQIPHDSSGRPQNRRRIAEPPHYTIFGFSRVTDDYSNVEEYIEHWYMHVYVDAKGAVTGFRFDKSTRIRRRLRAWDMNFLCVSSNFHFVVCSSIDTF